MQAQIEKGEKLRDKDINSEKELQQSIDVCRNWSTNNKKLFSELFDTKFHTNNYSAFSYFASINLDASTPIRVKEQLNQFTMNLESYRVWVGSHIDHLRNICTQHGINTMSSKTSERIFGDKIFIVHGHDDAAKHKIARFLADLDLTEIILDEQPGKGQTMIDKFKEHADEAGFAIVLLTADDIGAPKDKKDNLQPRARQNVILELGYFIALLGRSRVCVLYEKNVELPSDIHGLSYLSYTPMGNDEGWKLKLAREMKNIGFSINLDNLL